VLALPSLLFEPGVSAGRAIGLSRERVGSRWPVVLAVLATWAGLDLALNGLVLAGLDRGSEWLLGRVGTSLKVALPATAGLLVAHGLVLSVLSIVGAVSLAAVVLGMYLWLVGEPGPAGDEDGAAPATARFRPRVPVRFWAWPS
jgi:hypothetical protein